jgi:hypothetical protein
MACSCPNPALCEKLGTHLHGRLWDKWNAQTPEAAEYRAALLRKAQGRTLPKTNGVHKPKPAQQAGPVTDCVHLGKGTKEVIGCPTCGEDHKGEPKIKFPVYECSEFGKTTMAVFDLRLRPDLAQKMEAIGVKGHCMTSCPKYSKKKAKPRQFESLKDYFQHVVVVHLRHRKDRMESLERQAKDWPFREWEVFDAIRGDKVGVPKNWTEGGGAWGCLQSHRHILEKALTEDWRDVLILEDDLILPEDFAAKIERFLRAVPDDWDGLMIGGQHHAAPSPVENGIVRCLNAQRTHAYAVRGRYMRELYSQWSDIHISKPHEVKLPRWGFHCDHFMGPLHASWNVYAPDPFLIGQGGDHSDIRGVRQPKQFWDGKTNDRPLVLLKAPRLVMDRLEAHGWHRGWNRHADGTDIGMGPAIEFFKKGDPSHLRGWIEMIRGECGSDPDWTAVAWHPELTADMIRQCWQGKLLEITAETPEDALGQLNHKPKCCGGQCKTTSDVIPHVVYHIAALGNWREVVTEQLILLKESGLTSVRATFVGVGFDWLRMEAKKHGIELTVVRSDINVVHYETFAMLEIERLAKTTDRPILYMHTKGVSSPGHNGKRSWRRAMEEYVVRRWRDNLQFIADGGKYDAVGLNWHQHGQQHFSGNFWIARADWIRQLPPYAEYHGHMGLNRLSCEMWIGAKEWCRAKSLGCSNYWGWQDGATFDWLLQEIGVEK